jgi:hypothetical protein
LAVAACCGLAVAAFTVNPLGSRAESPLQFFTKQHRQQQAPSYERTYERAPVEVPREGLFGIFEYESESKQDGPRQPQAAAPRNLERVVCRRQCDGAQLVMGFSAGKSNRKQANAMCAAAGRGAKTELVTEKFVPGKGFEPPPVQTASNAPLIEGRASLDSSIDQDATPTSSSCPESAERQAFMSVPILHDATLRNGDVVAARGGFKVFVGKGKPPFKQSDFVDLDTRKRVSADLKKLRVSDR